MNPTSLAPVCVGHTDFPLRAGGPQPTRQWPLPEGQAASWRLLDGPPYANGALHLGHVLNKLLKDVSVRAQAAQGRAVTWVPRWDCHGLPVELQVERSGVDRHDPLAFVQAARTYAQGQVDQQMATFATLGVVAQWDHARPTMVPAEQAATLRVLAELVERQALQMREQPSPWCAQCASTLAGAEQEPLTVTRTEAVVPFALDAQTVVLSWTTTPWTMPYHAGLVVHPDARYLAWEQAGQRAWVSEAATAQMTRWYPEAVLTDVHCMGHDLMGRTYRTPLGQAHVVVGDARVAEAGGTGVLHAVPAFDSFDAQLGHLHGWPLTQALASDGTLSGPGAWEGHQGLEAGEPANAATLARLQADPTVALWLRRWTTHVEVPGCWRHQTPVVTRSSRQAFLALTPEVRDRAQAQVEGMVFTPAMVRSRMLALMVTRPDWCVSRQRTWGVPMALFLDRTTGQPHALAATWMRRVADAVAEKGVEVWWTTPRSAWVSAEVDPATVEVVDDVLDVWFDSGALGVTAGPADLVVEGHDQLRGWFQACVWLCALLDRTAPFARVVTHGFVVDASGRKLSKSKGGHGREANPGPCWSDLPADVVRWWALLGDTGADRPWSAVAVQAAQSAYARMRGCVRFVLANVPTEHWGRPWTTEGWTDLDVQDLHAAWHVRTVVLDHVGQGHYDTAARVLLGWLDEGLSKHLFGRLKDRLYCAPVASGARQAAVATLQAVGEVLQGLVAVVSPQLMAEAATQVPAWGQVVARERAVEVVQPWSAEALAVRTGLHQAWESLGQKGGLERARLVLDAPLPWPAWAVEEAWGVAQWTRQPPEVKAHQGARVTTPWGEGVLLPSPDPLCPRCRRSAPLTASGACGACAGVVAGDLHWRG